MSDWIEDGEAGSSVRGKLNALMHHVSKVTVTSPVPYFDMALPAGYSRFSVFFEELQFSAHNNVGLAMTFSANGGGAFFATFPSYTDLIMKAYEGNWGGQYGQDSLGVLSGPSIADGETGTTLDGQSTTN